MTPAPPTLAGYAARLARHVYDIAESAFLLTPDPDRSLRLALARKGANPALWQGLADHFVPGVRIDPRPADFADILAGLHDLRLGLADFTPDHRLYADHLLCVGDIARGVNRPAAAAWCEASANHTRELTRACAEADAGAGAGEVVAWLATAARYQAAMAAAADLPARPDPALRPARTAEPAADTDRLSVKDAAAWARVRAPTVYGWCASGVLAHSRIGASGRRGRVVILAADLDKFLASLYRPVAATPSPPAPARPASKASAPTFRHLDLG